MTWALMADFRLAGRATPEAGNAADADLTAADPAAAADPAMSDQVTDAALVARLRRGDEAALAEVYDRHAGSVYGVLTRLLADGDAQEVMQDVFLRLWREPGAYDSARAGLRAYLLVMARSRALDRLRAARPTLPLYAEDGAELPLPDLRPGPQARGEAAQRRERVRAALGALSAAHRETVERAFLRGEPHAQIAAAMGVPLGTVKSRVSYALRHLRRALGEEVEAWLE